MKKYKKGNLVSTQTEQEALKIAKGTQKPGQTKDQTKLIAQGIQKGIDQYKKQYKVKARELDKNIKKVKSQKDSLPEQETVEVLVTKQSMIPWLLLGASWLGFIGFYAFIHLI